MGKLIDMTGWVMSEHGVPDSRLTVIQHTTNDLWLVKCECGRRLPFEVRGILARNGNTKSCGCLRNEKSAQRFKEMRHKQNELIDCGEYYIGKTTNTDEEFYFSKDKYELVCNYVWRTQLDKRNGYKRLVTTIHNNDGSVEVLTMWKLITGYDYCEHANRNTFDNRNENLRPSTHSENMQNKTKYKNNESGFPGVIITKNNNWSANIRFNLKDYWLGVFKNKEDAILARIKAEAALFNPDFAPNRDLFDKYNINIEEEKKHWEEWVQQNDVNFLGIPYRAVTKEIVQIDLKGNIVAQYTSASDASRKTGYNRQSILDCCKGKLKTFMDFIWEFK